MFILNGIAYASEPADVIKIKEVKTLDDMIMIITFETGEKRLYDATQLLMYPAFAPLANDEIFKSAQVAWGTVIWCNGDIDIAPETIYEYSFPYPDKIA